MGFLSKIFSGLVTNWAKEILNHMLQWFGMNERITEFDKTVKKELNEVEAASEAINQAKAEGKPVTKEMKDRLINAMRRQTSNYYH